MNKMQFVVEINASKERVWDTLWQDETFREWSGIIDPGTYMVGDFGQGNKVQFISAENGYGVTSQVDQLVEHEYLLLKHQADTKDTGTQERDKEWTGGTESYQLTEQDGVTALTVAFNVPLHMEEYFAENYPKALAVVKRLAESRN